MSEEKVGIEKLKLVAAQLVAVNVKVIELAKGGLDLSDVVALAADEEFKKLVSSIVDFKAVVGEVKDVDLAEGLELAAFVIPKVIEAIKK
jgi:hypothetical protein